jgi:hypothetical protein
VLELAVGAFYDNSGGIVARDIIAELVRRLESDKRLKECKNDLKIELIRFTDTPAKRQGEARESAHSRLITPLVAYAVVRQSRGVLLAGISRKAGACNIYLGRRQLTAVAGRTARGGRADSACGHRPQAGLL